jgi:hypothetical protein
LANGVFMRSLFSHVLFGGRQDEAFIVPCHACRGCVLLFVSEDK